MQTVITEQALKAKAKALRAALADKGLELNHQACIDVMSRVEGEKSWAALNAKQNRAEQKAPAEKKAVLGFSEVDGASVFDYCFDVSFFNPEGNRVHQDLYLTLDDARQVQAEWRVQGTGWGADCVEFKWVSGVAVFPEEPDSFDFKHPVQFTRDDGMTFIDRFATAEEARREVKRWQSLGDSTVTAAYLGEDAAPKIRPIGLVQRKGSGTTVEAFAAPADWTPVYSPYRGNEGWYVSNVRYPAGHVGCVSNNYPDGKWRIVCDKRRGSLNEPGDFTFESRDAAARAEYALAKAAVGK